ncbi:hypothetical protein RIR_jg35042.t1 [Rhizophagus irregularis DAOM 181602=DAOM 197198]|nr:hypothetical protein RIR_jg35042.t1 [Rhizophagus irregularis DAOM 181602=DAOM 197198]
MVNYKDIELALVEIIKVAYSQGTKKYDKMDSKQRAPNEEVIIKEWRISKTGINEEVYQSLEKLYKLYLLLANQEEVVQKRSIEEVNEMLKLHDLEI